MKLLVLSDSQIGSGLALTNDRLGDQEQMLNQIAGLAEQHDVDLVLHAGDVFQSRHPSEEARLVFKRFARKTGLTPLVICSGNHDLRAADLPSALDLYDDCWFVRKPEVVRHEGAAFACLPWVPLARRVAARDGDRDGLLDETAALLIQAAADLRAKCGDGPAILATHWPISGASLPNGLPVEQLNTVVLPLDDLVAQEWDLVAAGDIHVPQILSPGQLRADENGSHHATGKPVLSCGSPWLNDFGEEHVAHGVWLVDIGDRVEAQFVPVEDRKFVTVTVDLEDPRCEACGHLWTRHSAGGMCAGEEPDGSACYCVMIGLDETDGLAAAIAARFPLDEAVVRIKYRATSEQARRVDTAAIRRLLNDAGAHRLYGIFPEIVRSDRVRVEGVDEQLGPLEALDLYVAHQGIEEGLAGRMRDRTAGLLQEARA